MALDDIIALLPAIILAGTALAVIVMAAYDCSHAAVVRTSGAAYAAALGSLVYASGVIPRHVTPLLLIDEYAHYYVLLILIGGGGVTALSHGYMGVASGRRTEYYALLLLASLGAVVLSMAVHGASLFLGLGLLSVSLYVLIAYTRHDPRALEAGLKYLLLSGAAAAFLLLGLALLYYLTGVLSFAAMSEILGEDPGGRVVWRVGLVMVLAGLGFKLALVPFHMWAPDVYQGSPTPAAAFVATVSKVAVVGVLLRTVHSLGALEDGPVTAAVGVMAIASMCAGNLLALLQDNVKRLLAYSSIAHVGYLLVALIAGGALGAEAIGFYMAAYLATMLAVFGVLILLSRPGLEAERVDDLSGLVGRYPIVGSIWIIAILSLAGIPLTAGFVIKFYVVVAGLSGGRSMLVLLFVLNSVIGLFYYLRLIRVALTTDAQIEKGRARSSAPRWTWIEGVVLASLVLAIFWLGLYPMPFIDVIQQATANLMQGV